MNGQIEIHRLKKRLDSTFARGPLPSADIEIQSDFAKYMCVLVSGFFENAIVECILEFARSRESAAEVSNFIDKELAHWTNPNTEKICNLLGSFSISWRKDMEDFLVDERKESVNSLVALRHKIVHGESVGTSLSQVKAYYATILDVIDHVSKLLRN